MPTAQLQLLELQDDGFHLLVEVVVFGQTFKAVLDTGASRTVLDRESIERFIDQNHLIASDRLSTGLGTNSMESHTLTLPELKIGDLLISNFETAVLDLSMINIAYASVEAGPIIGVIGGDVLYKYQAVINYKSLLLSFG